MENEYLHQIIGIFCSPLHELLQKLKFQPRGHILPHKLVSANQACDQRESSKKSKGRSHFGFYHSKDAVTSTRKFPASPISDLRCWLASLKKHHFLQAAKRLPPPATSGGIFDAATTQHLGLLFAGRADIAALLSKRRPLLRHRAAEDFRPHRNC